MYRFAAGYTWQSTSEGVLYVSDTYRPAMYPVTAAPAGYMFPTLTGPSPLCVAVTYRRRSGRGMLDLRHVPSKVPVEYACPEGVPEYA